MSVCGERGSDEFDFPAARRGTRAFAETQTVGPDAESLQLSRFVCNCGTARLGAAAQNVLGWLDRRRFREFGDAFPQPLGKDFAGGTDACCALKPCLWRRDSEKSKESGLVSRGRTLAHR